MPVTCNIAKKGFSGMQSSSPAAISLHLDSEVLRNPFQSILPSFGSKFNKITTQIDFRMKNYRFTFLFLTIFIFSFIEIYPQTDNDVMQILDLISNKTDLIIFKNPSGYISKEKLLFFISDAKRFEKDKEIVNIPDSIINELSDRFNKPDSANWTYSDFPNKIIISKRDTFLDFRKECARLGLMDKNAKKTLRGQINKFNNSELKDIAYISHPLICKSFDYAIVQFDNCINLSGGGKVLLLKKVISVH